MSKAHKNVIILGGGISGITTALTLQLLGYQTEIYTEHLVDDKTPNDPLFASLYPAASVIPHSIKSGHLQTIFPASQQIFDHLLQQDVESIELHRHFELFEFPIDFPEYTNYLYRCSPINKLDVPIPQRSEAPELHGWVFDCFIAKWPIYIYQLYQLYQQAGGSIRKQKIDKNEISSLPANIIINCTGFWSNELFNDSAEYQLIRGHLVHLKNQHPITDSGNKPLSYNYTPRKSVYAAPDGSPSDVYFYPILDRWILGGSRQPGTLNDEGKWIGKKHDDTILLNGIEIPRQILELNDNILNTTYKQSIDLASTEMKTTYGYRFTRGDNVDGLRLETEQLYGKQIIHNYGHGGAGVTLSWGCSLHVFHLLSQIEDPSSQHNNISNDLLKSLQRHLHQVHLEYF